jgi:hypothetical protein
VSRRTLISRRAAARAPTRMASRSSSATIVSRTGTSLVAAIVLPRPARSFLSGAG